MSIQNVTKNHTTASMLVEWAKRYCGKDHSESAKDQRIYLFGFDLGVNDAILKFNDQKLTICRIPLGPD